MSQFFDQMIKDTEAEVKRLEKELEETMSLLLILKKPMPKPMKEASKPKAKAKPKPKVKQASKRKAPRKISADILELLTTHSGLHQTAQQIAEELKVKNSTSVYRAVKQLSDRGMIEKDVVGGKSYYYIPIDETIPPKKGETRLNVQTVGARRSEGEKILSGEVAIAGQT